MSEDIFSKFPTLELDDIILRELTINDVKPFYAYISDPGVNKYISDDDIPLNLAHAEHELMYWADLFKYKRSIYWGIAKKKNNFLIGTCGFNIWSTTHKRAEISYDLAKREWGKGIMTKALRSICDFAFIRMNINRIQATVAEDNIASIKVLTKLNFSREGYMRDYGILHGAKKNFYMYSLLAGDSLF